MRIRSHSSCTLATLAAVLSFVASTALAQTSAQFDLPAQSLVESLRAVGKRTDINILIDRKLIGRRQAPALKAMLTVDQALTRLLEGTGLKHQFVNEHTVTIVSEADTAKPSDAATTAAVPITSGTGGTNGYMRLAQAEVSERSPGPMSNPSSSSDETSRNPERRIDLLEEIVVVGTNIRGAEPVGSPLTVITRDDIDRAGYASVPEVLRSLPQSYGGSFQEATSSQLTTNQGASSNFTYGSSANLRGLGNFSTLTLVNGRRTARAGGGGALSDTSMIPLSAVEQVEVLADGASAIYGSDAVGGVINFVLRRDFEGAETSVQAGTVTDGDTMEYRLSHAQGLSWNSGHLLATLEHYHRDNLDAADRPFFSDDLTRFGGPDLRSTFSNPGNIPLGASVWGIPAGQDGTALTSGDLTIPNLHDSKEQFDVLPQQTRNSAYLTMEQDLFDGATLFGVFNYGEREFQSRLGGLTATLPVQPTHPFYVNPPGGTNGVIQMRYSFLDDLGPLTWYGQSEIYGGVLGLDLQLGGEWASEVYANYSRSDDEWHQRNRTNSFYLNQALTDTDPTTTLNPFGDGSHTSDATLDRIRGYSGLFFDNEMASGGLKLDGPLISVPAGDVLLAVGAEYRKESIVEHTLSFLTTATPTYTLNRDLEREVQAAFAEVRLPLFGRSNRRAGLEELTLSLAGRVEEYSDFDSTTNPKIGFLWAPLRSLDLRGSYGTSFRAPGFGEASSTGRPSVQSRPDPASPTGFTATLVLNGSDPDLGPEEATVWTLGFDLKPESLAGFRAGVTYFSVEYENRIFNGASALASVFTEPAFAPLLTRNPDLAEVTAVTNSPEFLGYFGVPPDPTLVRAIADVRWQNLSLETQRGVDFDVAYRFEAKFGDVDLGVSGTRLVDFTQQVTIAAPERAALDTLNAPVDLRLRGRATWARGPWSAALFVNYTDSYRNETVTPQAEVQSWTTVDLNTRYAPADGFLAGVSLAINVQNLFDEPPPYALLTFGTTPITAIGYDPQQANALGRFVSLGVTKRW